MTNSKSTKRALLSSVLAILVCVAMLIGTTFAWFTDTAKASVNTIQAGNLDVQLLDTNGNSLEGHILKWQKAEGAKDEAVLWEPGCTYALQPIVIKNAGNLALKYKIVLSGIKGDAKLNDAISWTINDTALDLDHSLAVGGSDTLTISGKMYETAENKYQGLKIDGIAITVIATQDTVEHDSTDNKYDEPATYPEIVTGASVNDVFGILEDNEGKKVDFSVNAPAKDVNIDGRGVANVTEYTDGWINGDVTIRGVNFMNGACFTAMNGTVGTVTFENCTFYACDQSKIDSTQYGINSLKNSGDGLCLNVDTGNSPEMKVIIKNCTFVGEDDVALNRDGWKDIGGKNWNPDTAVKNKARGHAIAINAISGAGSSQVADSVLIEGCIMSGIRGNAIQLYTLRMPVTVKNCTIDSWGRNAQTTAGIKSDAAIRGDIGTNGSLTLINNYFGLNETENIKQVNVDNFNGNTNGSRTAGTY